MPKRTDIHKILIIGAGPIVIGQACEFDYSGTQACKALREEGFEVVLVNSNPATIMTDPEMADRTYIEPITPDVVEQIIAVEKPDAVLPTLGGQTGLNVGLALHESGVLDRHGCTLIGASAEAIRKAEDRDLFKRCMQEIGLESARSELAHTLDEARRIRDDVGLPCVLRPSFTLGGSGGGIAYNREEFDRMVAKALELSPVRSVLVEESVIGWKEYEMEVMRDCADNAVIVCSIENFDPMGVHTGDSITVAPAQTLTDKEYQRMRDASLAILRKIGVETGGSNVQFAVDPLTGRMIVIEMNPRVSRSSALASKATGFPIAKIAAKLAVGFRLDEIRNDITRETPACFEPTIDYVVTKIPRWAFEKFPEADPVLTTQMKSVGEVMAIGRTFKESLQKALRGLEVGRFGLGCDDKDLWGKTRQPSVDDIKAKLATPNAERIWSIRYALLAGLSVEQVQALTGIDPWFLSNIADLVELEGRLRAIPGLEEADDAMVREAKRNGFSDRQLATLWGTTEAEVRRDRRRRGILPVYKLVDTCAAEFEAVTPYYYSTYEWEDEARIGEKPRVVILGGGPNRIGQGIEFDYCCCQAAFALRADGFEVIMVNSNPETVSTDYDTSDRLFFEPLTVEDVLNICERVIPMGVIVQFGGQTPLNLARALEASGVPIIGTSPESIDLAEDRERFRLVIERLGLRQTPNASATRYEEARRIAERIGYPVVVRPSFVLGGRAMEIVYDEPSLDRYMTEAVEASPEHPILIDKFLEDASEVDVRRGLRRRADDRRRGDGTHRGGGHPLGRQRLRHPAVLAAAGDRRGAEGPDLQAGRGAEGPRADEHPVRGQGRRGLRAGGEPARLADGALRLEGDRAEPGAGGGASDGGPDARAAGDRDGAGPEVCLGEGGGVPVRQVRGRGYRAGARDAVDGRGDGDRHGLPGGVRQEPARGDEPAAGRRDCVRERGASRPQRGRADRRPPGRDGLPPALHRRHRRDDGRARHRRRDRAEDPRGPAQRAGLPGQRLDRDDRQHAQGQGRAHRRGPHPRQRRLARRALHHHDRRRQGGPRRHGTAEGGEARGLCVAGSAQVVVSQTLLKRDRVRAGGRAGSQSKSSLPRSRVGVSPTTLRVASALGPQERPGKTFLRGSVGTRSRMGKAQHDRSGASERAGHTPPQSH